MQQQIRVATHCIHTATTRVFFIRSHKPDRLGAHAARDHLLQTDERAAQNEEDVGGVDGREFLMWMLAATLRRNVGDCALQNFQKRLLYAFARHVARDGRVLVLTANLIDFVDIDDAGLRALDVPI